MAVDPRLMKLRAKIVDSHEECGGTGHLGYDDDGDLKDCLCMQVFKYLTKLIRAGVPRRYWHLRLEELKLDAEYVAVGSDFVSSIDNAVENMLGLMFTGSTGIGKTSLACEIAKEAIVSGYRVIYLTARQYIDMVFRRSAMKVANRMNKEVEVPETDFSQYDLIVFDEIDKVSIKQGSDGITNMVEEFLRMNIPNRSVIACSNLDEAGLEEMFGETTLSLIRRGLKVVNVEGKDYGLVAQDEWSDLMEGGYDYFHKSIVERAERMSAREMKETKDEWDRTVGS